MKTLRLDEVDFAGLQVSQDQLDRVANVLPEATKKLLDGRMKNVVGVGRSLKFIKGVPWAEPCIQVQVKKKVPANSLDEKDRIPSRISGIKTDVIEVGEPHFSANISRERPLKSGYSLGVTYEGKKSTGTLGAFVVATIAQQQHYFVLSNNHVLAMFDEVDLGTSITQPGPDDGGDNEDIIGSLWSYVNMKTGGDVEVDAALATVEFENIPQDRPYEDDYVPAGEIRIGMDVWKNGRTTTRTEGKVLADMVAVNILDDKGELIRMVNQVTANYASAGGDSGSLVVCKENSKGLGLHSGRTHTDAAYLNVLENVLNALGVELY